jgi:hypothetical protein
MHDPPPGGEQVVELLDTHVPELQQEPAGHVPLSPPQPVQLPPEHVGVFPLHAVPSVSWRQPFAPATHVAGVFPWHDDPAAAHPFVQHCADPAAP